METPLLSSSSNDSSSSSSSQIVVDIHNDSKKYDVFMSFSGGDTIKNIIDHLRAAFSEKEIKAFVEDDEIEREQHISPQYLIQAIEDSSCSIVFLSRSYASSQWCLEELVKINDCIKKKGQAVIPIFCHVDRSQLREQVRSFGEAFARDETNLFEDSLERVHRWRVAVTEVTGLAGLDLQNYRDETHFIKGVVAEVSSKLESVASSKIIENDRSCNVGRFIFSGGYGISSVVGSIGFILVLCLVVFPLFGMFVFVVAPNVGENVFGMKRK